MRAFMLAVTGLVFSVAACSSYGTSVVAADKTPAKVASVSVSVPRSLVAGQTGRGTATPKDANGAVLQGKAVLWSTSIASVASVTDSGVISAIAPGTTILSASSEGVSPVEGVLGRSGLGKSASRSCPNATGESTGRSHHIAYGCSMGGPMGEGNETRAGSMRAPKRQRLRLSLDGNGL